MDGRGRGHGLWLHANSAIFADGDPVYQRSKRRSRHVEEQKTCLIDAWEERIRTSLASFPNEQLVR
jgi:hypothetical protein